MLAAAAHSAAAAAHSAALALLHAGYYLWDWADEEVTGLNEVADLRSFITVYPQGMSDLTDPWAEGEGFSWNAAGTTGSPGRFGPTCEGNHSAYACYKSCEKIHGCNHTNTSLSHGCDSSSCVDDILFIEKMIDQLEADASKHKKAVLGDTNADKSAAEKPLRRRAPWTTQSAGVPSGAESPAVTRVGRASGLSKGTRMPPSPRQGPL